MTSVSLLSVYDCDVLGVDAFTEWFDDDAGGRTVRVSYGSRRRTSDSRGEWLLLLVLMTSHFPLVHVLIFL